MSNIFAAISYLYGGNDNYPQGIHPCRRSESRSPELSLWPVALLARQCYHGKRDSETPSSITQAAVKLLNLLQCMRDKRRSDVLLNREIVDLQENVRHETLRGDIFQISQHPAISIRTFRIRYEQS